MKSVEWGFVFDLKIRERFRFLITIYAKQKWKVRKDKYLSILDVIVIIKSHS
jgi:hypothetical protein